MRSKRANAGNVHQSYRSADRAFSSGRHDYGRRYNVNVCTCRICAKKFWGKRMSGTVTLCRNCVIDYDQPDSILSFRAYRFLTPEDLQAIEDRYKRTGVKIVRAANR